MVESKSNEIASMIRISPSSSTHPAEMAKKYPIWWSNASFFVGMHIVGVIGAVWLSPWGSLKRQTLYLCIWSWQLASFGVTIGYHRLWSHKGFTARLPLRIVLAVMGSLGFQGSIKWWVLRHRLHHRFTDDPVHDPYAASLGLLFSHMGWIFWKPKYERLVLIEKGDLERDPVVRFQHRHYIPIALFFGLVCPTVIALAWGDMLGGFIWGGVIARLLIWHCTFMINSLAHWEGLQPYTRDISARGSFIIAVMTSGEGNHNFHAFPQDFRNGPHPLDWDPTKWLIWLFHKFTPFAPRIRVTPEPDILKARAHVLDAEADLDGVDSIKKAALQKKAAELRALVPPYEWGIPEHKLEAWGRKQLETYVENRGRKVVLVDGWFVDVTSYIKDHPGGSSILSRYLAVSPVKETVHDSGVDMEESDDGVTEALKDATAAFNGGLNNHSSAAKAKLKALRVARMAA
ncbi:hypothetical protein DACRYDRAFT_88363 [Dacryopinax primogenitus]|uniref:Acyl-CoA desaturase n=1 Tax=Dacryopinax primogenitus (strain DJM 731) TaxID=1858805 RepID=M5G2W2_DACPD|nr:uncharacterized protein DACRYDRAFT_88363 [Dacryopinax primogenitus]EJU02565.1 hypothetical protein DACRYDRAFT_88363 [Dacryopinax primogenitus]